MHCAAASGGNARTLSEAWRQLPGFLNIHHEGTVGVANWICTEKSTLTTPCTAANGTNEPTIDCEPVLVSQAKLRFCAPPSPQQLSQRRFTVLACAAGARSRTRLTSRWRPGIGTPGASDRGPPGPRARF